MGLIEGILIIYALAAILRILVHLLVFLMHLLVFLVRFFAFCIGSLVGRTKKNDLEAREAVEIWRETRREIQRHMPASAPRGVAMGRLSTPKDTPGMASLPVTLECGRGVALELAPIPAGTFMMGSPRAEAERADDEVQHRVTISRPFYLGVHVVTQKQYRVVMGGRNPSKFRGHDLPVEQVSWYEAMAFCETLSARTGRNVRLPTEAEWEYACRAGTTTPFNTGETISADQANYDGGRIYGCGVLGVYRKTTTPVGSFPPNAWGLYDTHGNVFEWCLDWIGKYPRGKATDPRGAASGAGRVYRGGAWLGSPKFCRSAYRDRAPADSRLSDIGFRVAWAE